MKEFTDWLDEQEAELTAVADTNSPFVGLALRERLWTIGVVRNKWKELTEVREDLKPKRSKKKSLPAD